jgi:hypothetical protein
MAKENTAGRMRGPIFAIAILAVGVLGIGTGAWLAGSQVSTWRELHSWYNPAVGFQ